MMLDCSNMFNKALDVQFKPIHRNAKWFRCGKFYLKELHNMGDPVSLLDCVYQSGLIEHVKSLFKSYKGIIIPRKHVNIKSRKYEVVIRSDNVTLNGTVSMFTEPIYEKFSCSEWEGGLRYIQVSEKQWGEFVCKEEE